MKRILMFSFMLFITLFCTGCQITLNNFIDGQYFSTNEVDNNIFSKIKLELHQIDEEKYLSSNGVNVIRDISIIEYNKYFSFELYIYLDEVEEYKIINLNNFYPDEGSPQLYYAYTIKDNENYGITGITFMYNHKKIMISHNEKDYYYEISLK